MIDRKTISDKYLAGRGLEIGPGSFPWPLRDGVRCLGIELDGLAGEGRIVGDGYNPNVIDLWSAGFPYVFDFIVNSHVIEHTPRPVTAIDNWGELLCPGGILAMAIPNKDFTFDKPRRITTWEDLTEGDVEAFKRRQFTEWYTLVDVKTGADLEAAVNLSLARGEHTHFCVWDEPALRDFINHILEQGWLLREFEPAGFETFVVLERK
jgi:SAM-dependent methyltransferase